MERDVTMSCNGIFFQGPDGRDHCIPIYHEIIKWKKPDPDPEGRLFHDLGILATINSGIAQISDRRVRDTLTDAVQGAARSMPLPKGLKLGDGLFKGERMMEPAE